MATFALPICATAVGNCAASASSYAVAASNSSSRASLRSSGFSRVSKSGHGVQRGRRAMPGKAFAISVTENIAGTYKLPPWADFEIGRSNVFWETVTGEAPRAGSSFTIYFNPAGTGLEAITEYGIGFNGGFNQPIMCGGEPRIMTRKFRGEADECLYAIKINVPEHALTLEFSFTDGVNWNGPYKLQFVVPHKWRNQPVSFFNEGLAKLLSSDGACETAIYPEPAFVENRCSFPGNLAVEGGNRCDLDLVFGCTDPESPFFDPLANVPDGCPYISDSDTES